MRKLANICSPGLLLLAVLWTAGCSSRPAVPAEEGGTREAAPADARGFDPLELSGDDRVVPLERPRTGRVIGKEVLISVADEGVGGDTLPSLAGGIPDAIDTLNSQAFRVQISTSKLFGEARRAAAIAEEIFDRPVFVDYEVPYFKVRVGNFDTRDKAEVYRQKTRAVGYSNAWVVKVTLNVREVPGLYDDIPDLPAGVDSVITDEGPYQDYEE